MFCISAASRCARPLPHGFTGHVACPSRSILVSPALFLRFAQAAGALLGRAVAPLGEFRFQLIDFFHAALPFRTERGDFFLGETVEGHFPDAMRDDLGRCHFVEQRLWHAKSEPCVPRRQVEAAAVWITFFDAADIPEWLILGIDGRRQFDAELIPRGGRIWYQFPQLAKHIGDRIGQPIRFALIVKARDSFHDGGFLNIEHKITQSHDRGFTTPVRLSQGCGR